MLVYKDNVLSEGYFMQHCLKHDYKKSCETR